MHSSLFYKIFPPPKFMMMKHVGLDISDDAVRCLGYESLGKELRIEKFGSMALPNGLIDGGDIKDEKKLGDILREFDAKYKLSYVKVSVPEEKAYLFETDVPKADIRAIEQNIEFKLEENVPLSAADAVFYFDLLPMEVGKSLHASVSVVSRTYIESLMSILRGAGMTPMAFEVVPRSIARAAVSPSVGGTVLIVHVMNRKAGLYIVSGGVISFTSTISMVSQSASGSPADSLCAEIKRVYGYWSSREGAQPIGKIILVGSEVVKWEERIRDCSNDISVSVEVADVWKNIFSLDKYIPPISKSDSLDFAVAAGLGMSS